MELIEKEHHITITDMATQMGVSTRSVEKHVAILKEEKKLQRVESKKNGFLEDSLISNICIRQ